MDNSPPAQSLSHNSPIRGSSMIPTAEACRRIDSFYRICGHESRGWYHTDVDRCRDHKPYVEACQNDVQAYTYKYITGRCPSCLTILMLEFPSIAAGLQFEPYTQHSIGDSVSFESRAIPRAEKRSRAKQYRDLIEGYLNRLPNEESAQITRVLEADMERRKEKWEADFRSTFETPQTHRHLGLEALGLVKDLIFDITRDDNEIPGVMQAFTPGDKQRCLLCFGALTQPPSGEEGEGFPRRFKTCKHAYHRACLNDLFCRGERGPKCGHNFCPRVYPIFFKSDNKKPVYRWYEEDRKLPPARQRNLWHQVGGHIEFSKGLQGYLNPHIGFEKTCGFRYGEVEDKWGDLTEDAKYANLPWKDVHFSPDELAQMIPLPSPEGDTDYEDNDENLQ